MCCVDAVHVNRKGQDIHIRSNGLSEEQVIPFIDGQGSAFDQAAKFRQAHKLEMTLDEKLQVLDNLSGFSVKLDITGGDALALSENMVFLRAACKKFGKDNITLTITAAGLKSPASEVAKYISEFNFTFDAAQYADIAHRPKGYAQSNLYLAKKFSELACSTRAELPLTKYMISFDRLNRIYQALTESNIDKLLVMRLFPSGRGRFVEEHTPTRGEYLLATSHLRSLEKKYNGPKVKMQCALKGLETANNKENPCDLMRESYGLMADGTLLASAWAKGLNMRPLSKEWVLGNLKDTHLKAILDKSVPQNMLSRLDENFGHCKIFSYQNSEKSKPIDRFFDRSDPLYSQE